MTEKNKEIFRAFEELDSVCGRLKLRHKNRVELTRATLAMRRALNAANPYGKETNRAMVIVNAVSILVFTAALGCAIALSWFGGAR